MRRYRNLLLFLLLAAVWGSAFPAIKAGLASFPPVLFAAVRYDVAGVLMLGYAAVVVDDPVPRGRGQWALVAVGAVFLIAGYHAFLFVGEQWTTSAAAAVLVSASPVLTTGFARVFLPEERLAPAGVAGLLFGLAGVAVISEPSAAALAGRHLLGSALVFCAAGSFALGSVLTRHLAADLPIQSMEAWSMVGGAGCLHAASLALGEDPGRLLAASTDGWVALAYLSVVASALGFLVYFDLLDRLGAVEINLVSYVAPAFAAAVAWLFLGEVGTADTAVGFLLVVVGFGLLKRERLREWVGARYS